jgi:hypothetical protein
MEFQSLNYEDNFLEEEFFESHNSKNQHKFGNFCLVFGLCFAKNRNLQHNICMNDTTKSGATFIVS